VETRGHKLLEHTADMGLLGWGESLEVAFEETALALFDVMRSNDALELKDKAISFDISVSADSTKEVDLLIEFLNSILMESDIKEAIPLDIRVENISRTDEQMNLKARVYCIPIQKAMDFLQCEVKAATYYGSMVERKDDGLWYARCVVDL